MAAISRALSTTADAAFSGEPTTISRIFSSIRTESNPNKIFTLFSNAARRIPRFHSHRPIFNFTVRKLADFQRHDLVDNILSTAAARSTSSTGTGGFLARIISLYSSASMPDEARKVFFDNVPNYRRYKPFCAFLTSLLRSADHDHVIEAFKTLPKELSITPGLVAYNIYIRALVESVKIDVALEVLDEMLDRGIRPNIISYNAILDGFLKKKDFDGFEEILKEVSNQKLEFDVFTYNCRIVVACEQGKIFEAEELLDVMASKGVRPNATSFNKVIEGFCKEGDIGSAMQVFKKMKSANGNAGKGGVFLNVDNFKNLICGLVEKGEFGFTAEVCRQCLTRKHIPPIDVAKKLVEGLMKDSKVDEAKRIIEKMKGLLSTDAAEDWTKFEGLLLCK